MSANERAFDGKSKTMVLARPALPLPLIDAWSNVLLQKKNEGESTTKAGQKKTLQRVCSAFKR
jgi:hypothetical protein